MVDDFEKEKAEFTRIIGELRRKDLGKASLLTKALDFALLKHDGQYRKASHEHYAVHPIRVAVHAYNLGMSIDYVCIALLHDVLEDTDATYNELVLEFGREIADGVFLLSKKNGENYTEFIKRVSNSKDENLIKIKMMDMLDNLRSLQTYADFKGSFEVYVKYKKHFPMLLSVVKDKQYFRSAFREVVDYIEDRKTIVFKKRISRSKAVPLSRKLTACLDG